MRTSSSASSLRPAIWPAERDSTSFMYTSAPAGTTTSLSITIGASSDVLKTSPVRFFAESMASIVRTVTSVPAGISTVLGCGGGGGAGAAGAADEAVSVLVTGADCAAAVWPWVAEADEETGLRAELLFTDFGARSGSAGAGGAASCAVATVI